MDQDNALTMAAISPEAAVGLAVRGVIDNPVLESITVIPRRVGVVIGHDADRFKYVCECDLGVSGLDRDLDQGVAVAGLACGGGFVHKCARIAVRSTASMAAKTLLGLLAA